MWRRLTEILSLLLCTLGWVFVGCTLAMDRWRVARLGGQGGSSAVVTAWFSSTLWKDCYEDSTALVNCVDFGVLWTVKPYIQAVRGLLVIGLCLGALATALTFFGLECTHIGGDHRCKRSTLMTAAAVHLLGGVSDLAAYCLYISRVVAAFLHSKPDPSKLRYEMGPPLYLGLVGSFLISLGCALLYLAACSHNKSERCPMLPSICGKEEKDVIRGQNKTKLSDGRHIFVYKKPLL